MDLSPPLNLARMPATWQGAATKMPQATKTDSSEHEQTRLSAGADDGCRAVLDNKFALAGAVRTPSIVDGRLVKSAEWDSDVLENVRMERKAEVKECVRLRDKLRKEGVLGSTNRDAAQPVELSPATNAALISAVQSLLAGAANTDDAAGMNSILDGLVNAVDKGQDHMDEYTQVLQKLTEFFAAVTDLMAQLSGCITTSTDKDGNTQITVDKNKLESLIDKIKSDFANTGIKLDPAQADAWNAEFGGILKVDNTTGAVSINMDHLDQMRISIDNISNPMNPNQYQAWDTGFSAEKENIQTDMQTIAQKWSHQNSNLDSMVKILSGSIDTLMQTAKSFLQI